METWTYILIYVVSIIVLSIIIGEIRFQYLKKCNAKEKNKKQTNKEAKESDEFYKTDYRASKDCCNSDSYGIICVKCGRCGRKF